MTDEQKAHPSPPDSPAPRPSDPDDERSARGEPADGSPEAQGRVAFTRRRFIALLAGGAAALAGFEELIRRISGGEGSGSRGSKSRGGGPQSLASPDFPTLEVDHVPHVRLQDWTIRVEGLVAKPLHIDYAAWSALPRTQETVDFRCVEGWSVHDVRWGGVRPRELLALAKPLPTATHVVFHAYDGSYSDSLSLVQVNDRYTLLADTLDGEPLPAEHGGPVRLAVPTQLGYKNVKWVRRLELVDHEVKGYWETRGYPVDAPVTP